MKFDDTVLLKSRTLKVLQSYYVRKCGQVFVVFTNGRAPFKNTMAAYIHNICTISAKQFFPSNPKRKSFIFVL